MEIFRQEYWSGLPFPIPGDLPDSGIKPSTLASAAPAVGFFTTRATWEAQRSGCCFGPETKPRSTAWKAAMFIPLTPTKHKLCLVAKFYITLCNPMHWSPPDSSVHGVSQARILEWIVFPSPGDLLDPGIEPMSFALQVDSLLLSHKGSPLVVSKWSLWLSYVFCVSTFAGLWVGFSSQGSIMVQWWMLNLESWEVSFICLCFYVLVFNQNKQKTSKTWKSLFPYLQNERFWIHDHMLFFFFLIDVWLTYNIPSVSGAQCNDSTFAYTAKWSSQWV